jgi:C4-dicarboxylate-specific signal transduction histidine kinase
MRTQRWQCYLRGYQGNPGHHRRRQMQPGFLHGCHRTRAAAIEHQELENRLHRSEKMEALGLLAGGVAHDLNNILSGLVSYPELL